jgi:hypothetical protein
MNVDRSGGHTVFQYLRHTRSWYSHNDQIQWLRNGSDTGVACPPKTSPGKMLDFGL